MPRAISAPPNKMKKNPTTLCKIDAGWDTSIAFKGPVTDALAAEIGALGGGTA